MYMYVYIREHDQAQAYVVYSSPVTRACRGGMQAWAHTKKTGDQYFFVSFIVT